MKHLINNENKNVQQEPHNFNALSHQILQVANSDVPRHDFMEKIISMLAEFSHCETVELWLKEANRSRWFEIARYTNNQFDYEIHVLENVHQQYQVSNASERHLQFLREIILSQKKFTSDKKVMTAYGSFWLVNTNETISIHFDGDDQNIDLNFSEEQFQSLVFIPLLAGDSVMGLFQLMSHKPAFFTHSEINSYEQTAQVLSIALINQRAKSSLRERVKELTCLYDLARLAEKPGATSDDILQGIANLLPAAWQYPEITYGRIILDDRHFSTPGFPEQGAKQSSEIIVHNVRRGLVEVVYAENRQNLDEGPFLREERNLIDAIAREVSHIIERREAQQAKTRLEDQLRHADRLATIGQLAAGVAHELNEPLGNILGFAQLIQKNSDLSEQTVKDTEKIVAASLYAREVIRKLMLFARQTPPSKSLVNVNKIIQDGLYFLEARCQKNGIQLIRELDNELPEIIADSSQLHQVLVNLVVNAVQAMPNGGRLFLRTRRRKNIVLLEVMDEGIGMNQKILKQIFVPFFTTKDVDQGTGLGLAVVHGIITSHGGKIDVASELGRGSKFSVELPVPRPLKTKEHQENGY